MTCWLRVDASQDPALAEESPITNPQPTSLRYTHLHNRRHPNRHGRPPAAVPLVSPLSHPRSRSLKVSTERVPEAQIVMTIEVEPERVEAAREKAVRKLAPKAKVPGFRPGKAPANMVRRYFGEERVLIQPQLRF